MAGDDGKRLNNNSVCNIGGVMRGKTIHFICLLLCLVLVNTASAAENVKKVKSGVPSVPVPVTVLSIIPVQAEPGAKVTISGTGFGETMLRSPMD